MYVCNCNGLRERDVRRILERRVTDPAEVHRALGCQPRCGRCLKDIARMRDEQRRAMAAAAE
jgi:bacterioferritin-associated ferredoxin